MKTTLRVSACVVAVALLAYAGFSAGSGYDHRENHYILCRSVCPSSTGITPVGFPSPTPAGVNTWKPIGPDGANIGALAIDPVTPSTAYAGTFGAGVLKSTDGGATWTTANKGLSTANVSALVIDPTTPSTLYAGTDASVYKSTDGGGNWIASSQGLPDAPNAAVITLAIDPKSPATIYAGTSVGLFRTTDGAANWGSSSFGWSGEPVFNNGPSGAPIFITIDPTQSSTLYVGLEWGAMHKSTDTGHTWVQIVTPADEADGDPSVQALVVDPHTPAHLYLASSDGVLMSADGGQTWKSTDLRGYVLSLALDPASSTTIYAVLFPGAAYRSTDAGASWTAISSAPVATYAMVLAVAASLPPDIYIGDADGIVKSVDGAQTWNRLTLGVRAVPTFTIAADPVAPSTIYSSTWGSGGSSGFVEKTTDGGAHWARSDVGLSASAGVLAIDPASPSTVYAGTSLDGTGNSLYKSTDAGMHWVPGASNGFAVSGVQAIAIAASRPSTLYVIEDQAGVLKSADGGATLHYANDGLISNDSYSGLSETALAVDPTTPDTVFVATGVLYGRPFIPARIYKSTDGAANFRPVTVALPPLSQITSFGIDPVTPSTIYAGYASSTGDYSNVGGVLKSTDAGENWVDTHSLPDISVTALAIDPSTPSNVYAAAETTVYRSTDGAMTWAPFNAGLPNSWIGALAIDRTGAILRAATAAGLFEYRFPNAEPAGTAGGGYQGLWWAPLGTESGWGLNLAHQGNQIYATWFTYDTNGKPLWLSMLANFTVPPIGYLLYWSGTIYANTGPSFDSYSGQAVATPVGTGRLDFYLDTANFSYTVNGVSQVKTITRYDLASGPQPTCTYSVAPDLNAATNYTDLWWAAGGTEPGWGVNLAHQGGSVFGIWFTYGTDHAPLWLSVLAQRVGASNAYTGTLFRSSGPRLDAYDGSKVTNQQVGVATLTFADGNHASFAYATNGAGGLPIAAQTKQITRFLFSAPAGTVCQ